MEYALGELGHSVAALAHTQGLPAWALILARLEGAERFARRPERERFDPPDLIETLADPSTTIPGGDIARRWWLAAAKSICDALGDLASGGIRVGLSRCRFEHDDHSTSLDVAFRSRRFRCEVVKGDEVSGGGLITLWRDGSGGCRGEVRSRVFRVVCCNGHVVFDRMGEGVASDLGSRESVRRFVEAEVPRCALDGETFAREVRRIAEATGVRLRDPGQALRLSEKHGGFRLDDAIAETILARLPDPLPTGWELANAVTAQAHHAGTSEAARRLEALGGFVVLAASRGLLQRLRPGRADDLDRLARAC